MARKSKYEELVNETFEVEYNGEVFEIDVLGTEMAEKVSKKTGRKYRVRRLWVGLTGSATELEIGTQSWNKKSFMKRLIKESGIEFKSSTVKVIRGVVFGNITDLADFGNKSGMYHYYRKKYSFASYKEKLDNIYDEGLNGDLDEATRKLDNLKSEIRSMARCWVELEDDEDKRILTIDEYNLEKYCRGLFYESYAHEMYELIKKYREQLILNFFNNMGGFTADNVYRYIGGSKFGFDKCKTEKEVKKLYRKLSKELHPDLGGDQTKFIQMKQEYDKALQCVNSSTSTTSNTYTYQPMTRENMWESVFGAKQERPRRETSRRF